MQPVEPEWISSDPTNHTVFDSLWTFTENVARDTANLAHLIGSTTATLISSRLEKPNRREYRDQAHAFFGILFTLVKQLDYTSPRHDFLAALVSSLRKVPLPTSVIRENLALGYDWREHKELGDMRSVLFHLELDAPLHPPLEDRDFLPEPKPRPDWRLEPKRRMSSLEWANINSFVARIHMLVPDAPYLQNRGLFTLLDALEEPLTPTPLEDVLPAAACWLMYAGKSMKANAWPYAEIEDYGSRRDPFARGELWTEERSREGSRWDFWLRRLREIRDQKNMPEPTRRMASDALQAALRY